jgi:hypothetical protein
MPQNTEQSDRRSFPRFSNQDVEITVRPRGQLTQMPARLVDFNRHGVAVLLAVPLPKDKKVFIHLACGDICLDDVVGVVHNSLRHTDGYRCGIRFRTQSSRQFDRQMVERMLAQIEAMIARNELDEVLAATASSGPH